MNADDTMRILIKIARATGHDEWVKITEHKIARMGGKATGRVALAEVTEDGLDGIETHWFVVRCGNPDRVVLHTQKPAEAHRRYADEIELADKLEAEWIEDYHHARR